MPGTSRAFFWCARAGRIHLEVKVLEDSATSFNTGVFVQRRLPKPAKNHANNHNNE